MKARPRPAAGSVAAAALTLLVLLVGCAAPHRPADPVHPTLEPPQPPGVQISASVPPTVGGPAPQCDPLASVRPPVPMPKSGAMPGGTTMARIAARGRLVVGVDQNSYLLGYRDPVTGSIVGFDIDIAREVARAIFGDPNRIQLKPITNPQRIPMVTTGQVDLVAHFMTITCDRLQQVAFSTNYFDSGQRLLVHRGSTIRGVDNLRDKKVCATAGSTSLQNLAALPVRPALVSAESWTDCLVLLQQRQVDAVSTEDTLLAGLAAQDPGTEVVGPPFSVEPHGLAMHKTELDLVAFVNGVLERMRADGTWAASYTRWFKAAAPAPPPARYRG